MLKVLKHHFHELNDFVSAAAIQESEHDGSPELTVGFSRRVLSCLTVHLSIQYPGKGIPNQNRIRIKLIFFNIVLSEWNIYFVLVLLKNCVKWSENFVRKKIVKVEKLMEFSIFCSILYSCLTQCLTLTRAIEITIYMRKNFNLFVLQRMLQTYYIWLWIVFSFFGRKQIWLNQVHR